MTSSTPPSRGPASPSASRCRAPGLDGDLYTQWSAQHYFGDELKLTASRDGSRIVPVAADRAGTGGEWGARVGLRYNW